ncbi:hypothetical protein PoB_002877100 [Plakobranchus ocellatus]|uniref:Neurotransmitter-gated ion-channel transmembrane domain-containing protein n=1 Tax=Plakobranchus ocellatus TaxID=259542 RepID=A0AAV4A6I2_9GAST|nr:hypothetical protein PoB_002877100 [Plakobranchus ocellatus]
MFSLVGIRSRNVKPIRMPEHLPDGGSRHLLPVRAFISPGVEYPPPEGKTQSGSTLAQASLLFSRGQNASPYTGTSGLFHLTQVRQGCLILHTSVRAVSSYTGASGLFHLTRPSGLFHLSQVRDTYAVEFQRERSPVASAQKQRSAPESKACCQPCRYSNCASPVAMNRRETRYGPGKYKIANSCADGYIEMRAQFHHDTTGNDPKAAQENSCTEYHKVDFIPVHHQSERNCSGHTQGKCPCYTSRVYVSELHDCGSAHMSNRTGGGHRTFPSLDDHDAHPALRGIQQANTLDCFVPGGKQSPCSLPTVKCHLPTHNSKSIRFDCGNDLNNQKSRAGCCCLQDSNGDSDKKPGCGKCKDDTVYHNVSDVERGQEELAEGDNESEHYDDGSQSESVSEEEVDPELLTVPRSELDPVKMQNQQQGTLSKGLPFSSHDQQSGQTQATNVIQTTSASGSKPPGASSTYRTILRYLLNLIEIRQEQEVSEIKDEELFREWHDIAFVLDRLLFYLFFLVTLVSTVCILEMRPETEPL